MEHPVRQDIRANYRFVVDGQPFVSGFVPQDDDAFTVVKSPEMLARYDRVIKEFERPRLLELGIAFGGSVAWLSLVTEPELLVALELSDAPLARLQAFIDQRRLETSVRPFYGVDQADRARVRAIIRAEFGNHPIDVVIDDASHQYLPTKASFETIFPFLRPGGLYIIEDWKWENELVEAIIYTLNDPTAPDHDTMVLHRGEPAHAQPRETPCSRLALELVLARAESTGPIAHVSVDENWIVVERGTTLLDPETFNLDALAIDHYKLLQPGPPAPSR